MSERVRHPLVIIGLDGATFDLLDPLFARGRLPTLARLADGGLRTVLRSTLPPATLPAWSSFLTGVGPGRHGVTDIFVRGHGYGLAPASGRLRAMPTFLARLSSRALAVASLGVPGTYPPERVSGLCISGFDAPGASRARRRAFWPPELHGEVERLGGWRYATFNEQAPASRRVEEAAPALLADIEDKERVILSLYRRRRWDLFFVHLQASDTAAHHLWHTYDQHSPRAAHPHLTDALPRVYERLDALIGRLLELLPPEARVLVVSDHGMGGASNVAVHVNRWLHGRGLLSFRSGAAVGLRQGMARLCGSALRRAPPALLGAAVQGLPPRWRERALGSLRPSPVDFARTLAFSDELDYAPSVWVNRRGELPAGRVEPEAAARLCEEIREGLLGLRDPETGDCLVAAVHRREEALDGAHVHRAPDLLIEPAWPGGYRPSFLASPGPGPAVRRLEPREHEAARGAGMPGVHRREGVFIATGPELPAMELPALEIAQAGAIVYALLGVSVPPEIAAQLPRFLDEVLPYGKSATSSEEVAAAGAYSAAEELEVTRRLRGLGYID